MKADVEIENFVFGDLGLEFDLKTEVGTFNLYYDSDWVSDNIADKDRSKFLRDNNQNIKNAALALIRNNLPPKDAERLPYLGFTTVPFNAIQVSNRHAH